jgi:hypothetical protein
MSFNGQLLATGGVAQCLTDSVQVFGADGTYSSNKLLYQFENNVTNTVGSPSATNSGATFSSSTVKLGSYSAEFAGTTQHIQTNYSANDTSLTHSFWMYQQSITGSYNAILGNYWNGGGGVYGYYLWCDDPGTALNWRVHTSNSGFVEVTGTISLNAWHHVVITWSDTVGAAIYIDGVLAQFTASSLSRQQNSEKITLGNIDARGSGSVGYDGFLDQYRYYNRAVSASEAQTLYAETNATTSNTNLFNEGAATALYTLDYDASDAGGLYDGTPTDVTFGVEGKINYGARFNGSSSLMTITDGGIGANGTARVSFSVSLWIKTTASNQSAIISDFGTNYGFYIQMESSASGGAGKLSIANYYTGGLVYTTAGTAAINDGNWHNLVLVNNTSDNTQKLYIDGNTTPVISQSLGSGTKTANPLQVGYYTGYVGTYNFDGSIDQIRFLQTALNTSQIQTLNAETACNYTCTTDTVNYPTTNVAYYKLDNSADDETGVYDGTSTDVTYTFGRFGQAAVFNGSSSIINDVLSGFTYDNKNITFSAWIKSSKTTSGNNVIIGQGISNADGGWGIATGYAAAQKLSFSIAKPGVQSVIGSVTMNTGNWQHIVVVVDFADIGSGGTSAVKMYVDGVEDTGLTGNLTQNFDESSFNTAIGGTFAGSNARFFDGSIDQVRIFASALSDSQITELYNEKPCADTSTFAATLYDGNSNSAGQYVSSVGFQPDLTWIKYINSNIRHLITDSITGPSVYQGAGITNHSNEVFTSNTYGEFTSFDTNGFIVQYWSGSQYFNTTGRNYVAWNWKAGGDAALNQNGGTNSQVSANTAAGFSIVNWSGDNSTTTIGHGLNSAPEVVIRKNLGTSNWAFDTTVIDGSFDYLFLNSSAQKANHTSLSAPTSTVFSTSGTAFNSSSMIAYCWHSVAGKSSISTYEGDGTNDNTKQITGLGFDPSFVMVKNVDSAGGNWEIIDTARGGGNNLYANESYSQNANTPASYGSGQFISGGFSVTRGSVPSSVQWNKSGDTYLYMAFK